MRVYIVLWLTLFAHDFQRVEDYRVKVKRGRTGRNVKAPTWNSSKSSVTRTSLFEQRREKRAIAQAGYGNEGGQEGQPFLANITADAVHRRPTSPKAGARPSTSPLADSRQPVLPQNLSRMPRPQPHGDIRKWPSPLYNAYTFRKFTKESYSISDAIFVIDFSLFVTVWQGEYQIFTPGFRNRDNAIGPYPKNVLSKIAQLEARQTRGPPLWIVATERWQSLMDKLFQDIQWTNAAGSATMPLLEMLKGTGGGVVGTHPGMAALHEDPRSVFDVAVVLASGASSSQKVVVAQAIRRPVRNKKQNRWEDKTVGIKLWQRFTDAKDIKKFDPDILAHWSKELSAMRLTGVWVPLLIEFPVKCLKERRQEAQEQIQWYQDRGFEIDAICDAWKELVWWDIVSNGTFATDIDLGGFEGLDTVGECCGEGAFGCMGDMQ